MGSLVGEQYIAPARQKDNAMTTDVLCPIFMVVADAIYCDHTLIQHYDTPTYNNWLFEQMLPVLPYIGFTTLMRP